VADDQNASFKMSFESRKKMLDSLIGVPKTPIELTTRYVDLGRQLGKTYQLIQSLPEKGDCIILVHSSQMISHIKREIIELRPDINIKRVKFVSSKSNKVRDVIAGSGLPVFIDNAVFDELVIDFTKEMNRYDRSNITKK
jgi:hypothetical protein